MRDLDLFFVAGRREEDGTAWRLAKRIDEEGIAKFERPKIRPKSRVNPRLAKAEQLNYKAGYGIHFTHEEFPILSLSIFHEAHDLELNGIMNVDKILIPLRAGQSLMNFASEELSRTPYFELAERGLITDPFDGYMAWLHKKPEILNWLSISVEPPMKSIRILRSFAKCGYSTLPSEVQDRMRGMVADADIPSDSFEMMRSFLKILSDRLVAPQLSMLASIGTLRFLSPELQRSLEGLNAEAIEKKIKKGRNQCVEGTEIGGAMQTAPMQIFQALTLGLSDRARTSLLKKGLEAYPTTFA